jgi:hypothetical protein
MNFAPKAIVYAETSWWAKPLRGRCERSKHAQQASAIRRQWRNPANQVPKGRHSPAQGGRARAASSGTLGRGIGNRESSVRAAQKTCAAHSGLACIAMPTQGFGRFAFSTLGWTVPRFQRFVFCIPMPLPLKIRIKFMSCCQRILGSKSRVLKRSLQFRHVVIPFVSQNVAASAATLSNCL